MDVNYTKIRREFIIDNKIDLVDYRLADLVPSG